MVPFVCQYHGNVVYVPPGHMHQVENLQGCTKVDFNMDMLAELFAVCHVLIASYASCR